MPEPEARIRLLGLGNEMLADDAFGILVAREAERLFPRQVEAVCSSAAGFNLLDDLVGTSQLIVVDTIVTGSVSPGTLHVFDLDHLTTTPSLAPHSLGLGEVLAVGKQLSLNMPDKATVIAVEATDCVTIGGAMHPAVRLAISGALDLVRSFVVNLKG